MLKFFPLSVRIPAEFRVHLAGLLREMEEVRWDHKDNLVVKEPKETVVIQVSCPLFYNSVFCVTSSIYIWSNESPNLHTIKS